MSNRTHLSNFAGDKNECPLYMTIGNLSSKICQMPSINSIVMFALLSIQIKNRNIPSRLLDEQWRTTREVLNEAPRRLLPPLIFKQHSSTESGNCTVLCADGNFRCWKLVLTAWLEDCPEYSDLHHLEQHVCFWCECSKNKLGDYVLPEKQHPRQDHNLYTTFSDANTKAANADLSSRHVHRGFNVFQHIPCIVHNLPKPNLLHTIQIAMLDHLQKWNFRFM